MKIDWLIQKDGENTIGKRIENEFEKKPANVYMLLGTLKDSGLEIIENGLVDTKAKVQIIFGFDKKNTTKIMLENLLRYTKDVYGYDNNKEFTLEGNVIIFKYKDCASVYSYSGNTSEGSLTENVNMYVHVIYDLQNAADKEEYKQLEHKFKMLIKEENLLQEIKKTTIAELSANKSIFTQRIYNHTVKSVAELIAESKAKNKDNKEEAVEQAKLEDVKFDELDTKIDIDIDFSDESEMVDLDMSDAREIEPEFEMEEIEIPEEEYVSEILEYVDEDVKNLNESEDKNELNISGEALDLESMIFSKPSMKMNKDTIKKIKEEKEEVVEQNDELFDEEIKLVSKKINLKNVSTLVMQLPKQLKKGKDKDTIKIPNYIRELIPNFINMSEAESFKEDDEVVKMKTIELDILNIDDNIKYEDKEAMITVKSGQTYTAITSINISNIEIEENSIARILKVDDNKYSIEIIPVTSSEYSIWKKVCNLSLRGTNRKYGVM